MIFLGYYSWILGIGDITERERRKKERIEQNLIVGSRGGGLSRVVGREREREIGDGKGRGVGVKKGLLMGKA